MLDGKDMFYDEKGEAWETLVYKNGELVKPEKTSVQKAPPAIEQKTLYLSGAINAVWTKRNGKIDGTYKRFYESGAIGQKGSYHIGVKDGDWSFYRENGFIFKTMVFDAGKVVSESMYAPRSPDDPGPGNLQDVFIYVDGRLYRETVYENGKPKIVRYYKGRQVVKEDKL